MNAKPGPPERIAPERIALALSGGNALGAFQAGVYRVLHDAGVRPDWILGTSIGAVNGAIIAGNPVERRIERLQRFWSMAGAPSTEWTAKWAAEWPVPAPLGAWMDDAGRLTGQAQALLFGRPGIFAPHVAGIAPARPGRPGGSNRAGSYDLTPLRATLETLVDFDRLNHDGVRLTVLATDLETGEEVPFDTQRQRIGPEHIMASAALVPDFRPVEIDGRVLGDGGLRANLPVEALLRDPPEEHLLCIAVDLFSSRGERPASMASAFNRRQELLFASQSRLMLEAHQREDRLRRLLGTLADLIPEDLRDRPETAAALAEARRPGITVVPLACPAEGDNVAIRTYDYSQRTLSARWQAGALAATEILPVLAEYGAGRNAPKSETES